MKVVLATRNQGKIRELRRIVTGVEIVGLEEFPGAPEVPETELTFAGNALLKAHAIADCTGLPAVSDDSGLCVAALGGMPGVFSARWAGRQRDDRANLELVLDQIADVADEHRGAHFACVAAVALPAGEARVAEGRVDGRIVRTPRGAQGFGYDPVFVPDEGDGRTMAELAPEEKDAISHRGRAFRALAPVLTELIKAG